MKRAQCEPSSGQAPVDFGNAKWQDLSPAAACAFEALNALAKFGDDRIVDRTGHFGRNNSLGYALMLPVDAFSICSFSHCESTDLQGKKFSRMQLNGRASPKSNEGDSCRLS
ncbi:hypothetical protein [Ensifer sesbaniae]|nr:hypothetical protein [Ensifer sesbaniae]